MPIRELPEAPASLHILGPGMLLAALGVGLGETYLWPRLGILFGPEIRWLFFVGVTLQAVVLLQSAPPASATRATIFFGAAPLWRPTIWLFFSLSLLGYMCARPPAPGA